MASSGENRYPPLFFVKADSKEVTGAFVVKADSKGLTLKIASDGAGSRRVARSVTRNSGAEKEKRPQPRGRCVVIYASEYTS